MRANVAFVDGNEAVALEVTGFSDATLKQVKARMEELLPVLQSILEFDEKTYSLSEADLESRAQICAAMNMKYQALLSMAAQAADAAQEIATGDSRATEQGFPEFDHG